MDADITALRQQIADLQAALQFPLPTVVADLTRTQLAALQQQLSSAEYAITGTNIAAQNLVARDLNQGAANSSGTVYGAVVGLNLGQIIFGRDPDADEQRRLARYLAALVNKWSKLELRGKDDRSGEDNQLSLARVYTLMAVKSLEITHEGPKGSLAAFVENGQIRAEFRAEHGLPHHAITAYKETTITQNDVILAWETLDRSQLATEAVSDNQHLILLGDPGGGKSTFIHHLAISLAQHDSAHAPLSAVLPFWNDDRQLLPIILPLRELAGALARHGVSSHTVYLALRQAMESYSVHAVDDLLSESLHRGVALLLFDGLDEVPLASVAGEVADRITTLRAVRDFAQQHSAARVVVTCRVRAFEGEIKQCVIWPVETLAPWTLGQIRHFVPAWYNELAATTGMPQAQAARASRDLVAAIVERPKLAEMARTPLLLTMMALVLYNDGTLPRDRPQLYERVLAMLLGRWDSLRGGDNLATAIGHPSWDSARIRVVLDELSYNAHREATSADGRGRITRAMLRDNLTEFFKNAQLSNYADAAERCLEYFQQRSGLLLPDDERDSFIFAHLTLQEHCAGCYLVSQRTAVEDVLSHRTDDRFREPLFLGLGMLQEDKQGWLLIEKILARLISRDEAHKQPKTIKRWGLDLLLAAELGADRNWHRLKELGVDTEALLPGLRDGLVEILETNPPVLPVHDRVQIGNLLADLGDPRPGVCTLEPAWCDVPAGPFSMVSKEKTEYVGDNEKPQRIVDISAFRIAKYPVTNWQYEQFTEATGYKPHRFGDKEQFNYPNEAVVDVQRTDALAYCAWLSTTLGYEIRLPADAEWQKAASERDRSIYPWPNTWEETEENMIESAINGLRTVGCFPERATPFGCLDMIGMRREWTNTRYKYEFSDPWTSIFGFRVATGPAEEQTEDEGGSVREEIE